ncbi:GP157 protein, partial [Emberiza fucata]|nr:GP157 protein [Emberiza fucata]
MPSPLPPTPVLLAERVPVLLSCALSCAGSALLLCSQALWPELRTRPRQLLLHLSLADLLSALSYFYGVLRDFQGTSWDCVLQGALSTFANTSSFFWTMAIALYLYLSIVRGSPAGQGLLWGFHAVRWVLCAVLGPPGTPTLRWDGALGVSCVSVLSFSSSSPQIPFERGFWCLLTNRPCLALGLCPACGLLLTPCPVLSLSLSPQHAALSEYRPILPAAPALRPRASVADKKLILIPLIFIFLRVWSTVRFVLTLCDSPAVQNPVLVVLHGIGNTFQGGANCILFVLCTRAVRARLLALLCCSPSAELPWPGQGPPGSRQHPQTHGDGDKDKDKDVDVPRQTKPLLNST